MKYNSSFKKKKVRLKFDNNGIFEVQIYEIYTKFRTDSIFSL